MSEEGFRIASAFVKVEANDDGLHAQMAAKVREAAEGLAANVKVDADAGGLAAKLKAETEALGHTDPIKVPVEPLHADFETEFKRAMAEADAAGERAAADLRSSFSSMESGSRALRAAMDEMGQGADSAGRRTDDAGQRIDSAGKKADGAGKSAGSSASGFLGLSGAAWAAVGAVAALGPALAAVPALAGGVAGALGVMALGLTPIIKTLHDVGAETNAVGTSGAQLAATEYSNSLAIRSANENIAQAKESASRAAVQADQAIADAQRSLGDAERSAAAAAQSSADQIVSAQQRVAQAAYSTGQAEQSYTNALYGERQAQLSLTAARADAENQLADAKLAASGADLAVEGATRALAAAELNLKAAQGNSLLTADQQAGADLQVREAKQALAEAKQHDKEATEKATAAQKEGVDGAPSVLSAQHALQTAADGVAAAQHGITTALQGQEDAQHSLAKAQRAAADQQISSDEQVARARQSLADAQTAADQQRADSARQVQQAEQALSDTLKQQSLAAAAAAASGSAASDKVAKDMKGLTDAGRDFVNEALSWRDALHELSATGQSAMLPGFTSMLEDSKKLLPDVNTFVHDMGVELGDTATAFGHLFADPQFDASAEKFSKLITGGFGQFASALPPLLAAIVTDGVQAGPIVNAVAGGVHDLIATGLPSFLSGVTTNASGTAQGIGAIFHSVDDLLGPVGKLVGATGGALGPALDHLEPIFAALGRDIDQDLLPIMPELSKDLVDIADVTDQVFQVLEPLIPVITHGLAEGLAIVDPLLRDTATFLHDNADWLTPVAGGILAVVAATKAWNIASGLADTATGVLKKGIKEFTSEGKLATAATKGWGAATSNTAASLGKALPLIGAVMTGAGLLGSELGKLSGVGDHTALNVNNLTTGLYDAAHGSDAAEQQIDRLATGMAIMSDKMGGSVQGAKDIDSALTALYASDAPAAADEFAKLSAAMEANGIKADDVTKMFPGYTQALSDAATQAHVAGKNTDAFGTATQDAADTADHSAAPFSGLALHLDSVGQAGKNSTDDLKNMDAQLHAIDLKLANRQAMDDYTKALGDLKDGAKGSTREISGNSQAALDNRAQLDQTVQTLRHVYDSQVALHGPTDQVNQDFQTQVDKLRDQAEKTYGSKHAVDDYLTSLGLVPASKTTKVDVNTEDGLRTVKTLQTTIDTIHGPHISLTIEKIYGPDGKLVATEKTNSLGDVVLSFAGSRIKASTNAAGGPVRAGEVSWVGEKGPELVQFDRPGTVIPNHQIRQVGPGTSPAGTGPVINLNYYGTTHPTPEQRQLMYRDLALAVR